MNIDLSPEAREYGEQARRAFEAAGGDTLLQRAEAEPMQRASLVAPVLAGLGAWDLEPRADTDSAEAAAALCRSAGYWGLPYPLAERLARPADIDADGLIVVAGPAPAATIFGVEQNWATVTLDGRRARVTGTSAPRSAFVTSVTLAEIDDAGARDIALALLLPCWTLLGMLDRALDLTVAHVTLRQQFGQPLSRFQGVQFQLTDAEVERIVRYLKEQGVPEYLEEITAEPEAGEDGAVFDKSGMGEEGGDLYERAVAIVLRDKKASTSYVQRRLQIGYNRAATIIERMEMEGIISAPNHQGKREILAGGGAD